jgi:hypothetical protein
VAERDPPNRTVEDPSVDILMKKMERIGPSKLSEEAAFTIIG